MIIGNSPQTSGSGALELMLCGLSSCSFCIFCTAAKCLCWSGFAWIVITPFKSLQKLLEKWWTCDEAKWDPKDTLLASEPLERRTLPTSAVTRTAGKCGSLPVTAFSFSGCLALSVTFVSKCFLISSSNIPITLLHIYQIFQKPQHLLIQAMGETGGMPCLFLFSATCIRDAVAS